MKLSEARSKFGKPRPRPRPTTPPVTPLPSVSEPEPCSDEPDPVRDKGLSWARETEAGLTAPDPPRRKPSPLFGKTVRFSGRLKTLKRDAAIKAVRDRGGYTSTKPVNDHTDYLVVGDARGLTSKIRRCHDMKIRGHRIMIISETEFLELLGERD